MGVVQDSEYILFKAVAQHIKTGLSRPLNNLSLKCFEEFLKFKKQNALFLNCETYEDLGDNSKKLKVQKTKLLKMLAVQDRLEKTLKHNEQRIEFISSKLEQMGIYNDAIDKKTFVSALSRESKNISEKSLNLNPKKNGGITFKFFAGEIIAFKDDVLDFGLEENRDVLLDGSAEFFHEFIFEFPYSVATIPDEFFMMPVLKNKVLKECVLFVAARLKTQSIFESNKELGSLLANTGKISEISVFANELKNYFNVVVKQCVKSQVPELAEEADLHLKCNESSEFLPFARRKNGDKKVSNSEAQESESKAEDTLESQAKDVQKDSKDSSLENEAVSEESNAQRRSATQELLDLLLSDDEDDFLEDSNEENQTASDGETVSELETTLKELDSLFKESDEDDDKESKNG